MRLPHVLAPLRHRDFRLLWAGQTVSGLGDHARAIALPFQALALGASPLQLGLTIAIETGTSVALLLLGGAIADRVSRRRLIIASDLAGGCVVAVVALLSASARLGIEHLYVAAAALGAADAFLAPAYNAIVADLVAPDALRAGNAVRLLGRSLGRIVGPTLGGLAVALYGPALAFAIDAATFFFSFASLLSVGPGDRAPSASGSVAREIRDGLRYVLSLPWLWTTTLYFMLVNVAYAGQAGVMTPLLVLDVLGGGAATYGAITAAYGIGTIVASVVAARVATRGPGKLLFGFELLAAASVLAIGALPFVLPVIVLMALTGVGLSSSTVIWQALVQRNVPQRMLGRVSSIDLLGNALINPAAPVAAAAVVGAIGAPATFIVAGGYAVVLASVGLLASPLRNLDGQEARDPRGGTPPLETAGPREST